MGVEVTDLRDLDPVEVQETQETLAELMQELDPTIDTRRGVLHDILFHNEAIYANKNETEVDRLKRSQSLLAATEDPELAEDEILDAAASNYRVTRGTGAAATGEVTIIVNEQAPLTIAAGTSWDSNGVEFTNVLAFAAVVNEANVASDTDRVLSVVGDGTFSFTIDVQAVLVGTAGSVNKDSLFVPTAQPVSFVKAFAASDFTGGQDGETNTNLIGRLLEGAACKALSGSVAMNGALTAEEEFENVVATSIIGFGDGEMLRDQHSIFPGSYGGRVDWYIRAQERAQLVGLTKTATLVEKTVDNTTIWQFGVGRDDLPGFFDVFSVVPKGTTAATTFLVTSDVRSRDLTPLDNDGFLPDLVDDVEAVYSRFQATVIQFEDTSLTADEILLLTEGTSTADYDVTLRGLPLIADIQDWVSGRGIRNKAGDALIKSPVPCFMRISFSVQLKPGQEVPDTSTIANNVAALVNRYGFTGRLPASAISDVVHNSLSGVAHIGAIDLLGDIRRPDGTIRRIRTTETLIIPDEPTLMVTSRTVAFFSDPADIAISIETADIPEV